MSDTAYNIGFLMDQIAGHVTNYRNLRLIAESDINLCATWHEIYYLKPGGLIETSLAFLPTYYTGVLRGTVETRRALRSQRYDALMSNASVGVFFSRAFRQVPTLLDFDSTPRQIDRMTAYGSHRDTAALAYLKWNLSRRMYQSAALLQSWSEWAKQSVVEEYGIDPAKVVVNPPGINLDFWKPAGVVSPTDSTRPHRVLFVGGDFERKGGRLLLDWYKTQPPGKVELHVVTREQVPPRPGLFTYYDMQPNRPELLRLYHTSDVFVLPSLGECFGIATIEAMGAGLPVVVSDVGGTRDIVEPERNGYIVPGNDISSLGQAIDAVLRDKTRRREMGFQSRQLAEERFDLGLNARRTLAYLKQIAASRPAAKCAAGQSEEFTDEANAQKVSRRSS